ncbi:MAG TPA: hypothetical protein VFI24_02915 [Pyrinomonadaceae bacterium]|nr:hypothetical protein [Pyrinomonadaceae bacterium]
MTKPPNKSKPVAPPVYRPEGKTIVQAKMITALQKSPTPPPVYRPQPVPRVLQTKRSPGQNPPAGQEQRKPPSAPPVFRPEQKRALQPKLASKVNTRTGSVIQRARDKVPDSRSLPGASVPDLNMESYKLHVASRTVRFFQQVLSVALAVLDHGGSVRPRLFTDHAKVQVQVGQRHKGPESVPGENNWDAAHLMNTSLNRHEYAAETGQGVDDDDVRGRYVATGATVNQFQKSNVSADKIIDTQQTVTKNEMLGELQMGAKFDAAFVERHLLRYLTQLAHNLKASAGATITGMAIRDDSYTAAFEVITAQLDRHGSIMTDINAELGGRLSQM